ncbi:hypothetical protein K490DRAFT_31510 [Saccharata proteae CBS 121410]|uniref:Calcofluor white hypersensitive protein n=1 Tax=Saccharata proteae CBS 121410 TaxID=1314787 RepID=A0A9P4I1E3_9PEZI|nr:hypothetical protein K490DRAFT_31510 [Saccharata proteae CBS 121410]
MSRKLIGFGTLGLTSVGAYYLYQAGGSPKVAEKQVEHDAARLSSTIKGELPGRGKEAKTTAKVYAQEAGEKIDSAINDAKAQTSKVDAKLEAYRANADKKIGEYKAELGKEANQAIDKFDRTVEQKASESKSWVSSWFGGK